MRSAPKFRRSAPMMRSLLTGAALLVGASAGHAADMLQDPPFEAPEVVTKPAGGWYLRGDISYMSREIEEIYYGVYANGGNRGFTRSELEDTFGARVGVGYQINENFRVDATLGYKFTSDFDGTTDSGDYPCPSQPALGLPFGQLAGTNCTSSDATTMTSYSVMANAYFDLGNFSGFTPYVGAGIGGAYVSYETLTNTFNCTVTDPVVGTCTGLQTPIEHPGESQWRFAYAFHAGLSYDITPNAKIDLGYSYEAISGGQMFGWDAAANAGTTNSLGPQAHDEGIHDHIFRAGIRYQIW
ncbi:MAG: outer membrane protein [Pseudomonadota bacterium]